MFLMPSTYLYYQNHNLYGTFLKNLLICDEHFPHASEYSTT